MPPITEMSQAEIETTFNSLRLEYARWFTVAEIGFLNETPNYDNAVWQDELQGIVDYLKIRKEQVSPFVPTLRVPQ